METAKAVLQTVTELSGPIFVLGTDGEILGCNRRARQALRIAQSDSSNLPTECLRPWDGTIRSLVRAGSTQSANFELHSPDGFFRPIRAVVLNVSREFSLLEIISHEGPAATRRFNYLGARACTDAVSGVPNAKFGSTLMQNELAIAAEHNLQFGVLAAQVRFEPRPPNSTGAEPVVIPAEALWKTFATAFVTALRPTDFLIRWNENRFIALLPGCPARSLTRAEARVQAMLAHCGYERDGLRVVPTLKLASIAGHRGDTERLLLQRIDEELEDAGTTET